MPIQDSVALFTKLNVSLQVVSTTGRYDLILIKSCTVKNRELSVKNPQMTVKTPWISWKLIFDFPCIFTGCHMWNSLCQNIWLFPGCYTCVLLRLESKMWQPFLLSNSLSEPIAAMSLDGLPFSLTELDWDKLDVVAAHLKLRKADAFDLLTKLLGPHPGMDVWLHFCKKKQ